MPLTGAVSAMSHDILHMFFHTLFLGPVISKMVKS